jgi:hypothetical protein
MVLLNYANFSLEINVSLEPEYLLVVTVFGFIEVAKTHASEGKVVCCHFSSNSKLLATRGHDKKGMLICTFE